MRETRSHHSKDDLSWSEVGEMAYGYLRIPMALILVQVVYWWATEPDASLEPLQVLLAWLWTGCSNLIWPGSAELVFHGPSQSWTGVNLVGSVSSMEKFHCTLMQNVLVLMKSCS